MSSHEESSVFDVISQGDDRNQSSIGVIFENQNYGLPSQYRLSETRITQNQPSSDDEMNRSRRRARRNSGEAFRTRTLKENSKWSSKDLARYWKFYLKYQISRPYQSISWGQWKSDSIYKHMSLDLGKTPVQCKSKDQNMKTKLKKQGIDIIDNAVAQLKKIQDEDQEIPILLSRIHDLSVKKSEHMELLEKRIENLRQDSQKILKLFSIIKLTEEPKQSSEISNNSSFLLANWSLRS